MKRLCAYGIVLTVLAVLFAGCSERVPGEDSYHAGSQSESDASSANGFEGNFPVSGFASQSQDELLRTYPYAIYPDDRAMQRALDTPLAVYINTGNEVVLRSYDKITGNFSVACRDPLCDHETCLWGCAGKSMYCGSDGLFFLVRGDTETVLYRTDFFGNDVKELYRSGDTLSHVVQEGQTVYFLAEGEDETSGNLVGRVLRLDLTDSGAETVLSGEGLSSFLPMNGRILYYDGKTGENYRLLNPQTGEDIPYASSDILPLALYGEDFYYRVENSLCRKSDYGLGDEEVLLRDTKPSELLFGGDGVCFLNADNEIYRADGDFAHAEKIYTAPVEENIWNVILDRNLLFYTYTVGNGASRRHFFVFADLKTGETLQIEND